MGDTRHLLLVGGGHAQIEVLRQLSLARLAGWRVTLLTREVLSPYSGMLPGVIAGTYRTEQAMVDMRDLAERAGATLLLDAATGLDPAGQRLRRAGGPPIPFDLLSIDTGARPDTAGVKGAARHALPLKPIDALLPRLERLLIDATQRPGLRIAVVGAGAAGVEVACALRQRLPQAQVILIAGMSGLLPDQPEALRTRAARALTARRITLEVGAHVQEVTADTLLFAHRAPLPVDAVLWATGATAPPWLSETGLARDPCGFLRIDEQLRALGHANIFAAGDVASLAETSLPKAGVFAVRQGPVLAANLRATALGKPLTPYRAQSQFLVLIALGDGSALGTRNGLVAEGRWVWRLKDQIDRRFMRRYQAP
jgi:selenide,water dikinase